MGNTTKEESTKFWASDEGLIIEYSDSEVSSAAEAAEEYFSAGDYLARGKTYWIVISAGQGDEESGRFRFEVPPEVPKCSGGEHDMTDEGPGCGVRGSGGGVVIKECCRHCGVTRITNTWDHDPATGEQGLESVEWLEADDLSQEWVESLESIED